MTYSYAQAITDYPKYFQWTKQGEERVHGKEGSLKLKVYDGAKQKGIYK